MNPSRLAAAALLAALPVVGLAATAAPAHAAAPVPAQQQPTDGHDDGLFGGARNLGGGSSGMGDRLLGGFGGRDSGGLGGRDSTGFGDRGSMLGGLG
ncbi:hypothetical protein ACFXO2_05745 [Streptomyces sp. NPDC059152]|uniref:hypothetical protein n=1 Tax=Streptomyces sp. NPDC059152 TaxID=3346742 RepID=UPI0036C131BF